MTSRDLREWLDYLRDQGFPAGGINDVWESWKQPTGSTSVKQAAQQLGVSKETVFKLCADGMLSHARIGRRITITPAQLAEYQRGRKYTVERTASHLGLWSSAGGCESALLGRGGP